MAFSSGRSSKGKASAELSPLLQQHLPKRARTLVSPLSDDDREVLTYMLAIGLHLQMLAGIVLPSPQQKISVSSLKVCSKLELDAPSRSLPLLSSKPRARPGKASLLLAHKTSCSCGCFSCYSSFWRRWAASPNRDLLSAIIEMAEVADDEEHRTRQRSKASAKNQAKEPASEGKKFKAGKRKAQGLQSLSGCHTSLLPSSSKVQDCTSMSPSFGSPFASTSIDSCSNVLLKNVCLEGCQTGRPAVSSDCGGLEAHRNVIAGVIVTDEPGMVIAPTQKLPTVPPSHGIVSVAAFEQVQVSALPGIGSVECVQAASGDHLRETCICKAHCVSKRKSNQIAALDGEGTFPSRANPEECGHVVESFEGCSSPKVDVGVNVTESGVLSRILPHTLCHIVSRIWELVSLGSWSHIESY